MPLGCTRVTLLKRNASGAGRLNATADTSDTPLAIAAAEKLLERLFALAETAGEA